MRRVKDWLLGITAAALAVALAQALTPEGTVKKIGRLAGGLVLLLAALRPLTGWQGALLETLAPVQEAGEWEETASGGLEVMKTLIAEKTGAYIVDKGLALGLSCRARVEVACDGSGWPVPWEATIFGTWTDQQQKTLSQAVEQDLGIPVQRQSFREEGT